jgi:hypothetical protein
MRRRTWTFDVFYMKHADLFLPVHHTITIATKSRQSPMVFCLGYPKTGTTSLYHALRILGYRTVRLFRIETFVNAPSLAEYTTELERQHWKPFIDEMKRYRYDAYTSFPIGYLGLFEDLDHAFPHSKFILTTRTPDQYAASYDKFFHQSPWEATTTVDLEREVTEFTEHNTRVVNYFRDKPDQLLCLDIINGEGWPQLCPFLDKPVPKRPFPHKNETQQSP